MYVLFQRIVHAKNMAPYVYVFILQCDPYAYVYLSLGCQCLLWFLFCLFFIVVKLYVYKSSPIFFFTLMSAILCSVCDPGWLAALGTDLARIRHGSGMSLWSVSHSF